MTSNPTLHPTIIKPAAVQNDKLPAWRARTTRWTISGSQWGYGLGWRGYHAGQVATSSDSRPRGDSPGTWTSTSRYHHQ